MPKANTIRTPIRFQTTILFSMFILLFNPILAFDEQKLPRRWRSFELVKWIVQYWLANS
jgi:hypothetical protein